MHESGKQEDIIKKRRNHTRGQEVDKHNRSTYYFLRKIVVQTLTNLKEQKVTSSYQMASDKIPILE